VGPSAARLYRLAGLQPADTTSRYSETAVLSKPDKVTDTGRIDLVIFVDGGNRGVRHRSALGLHVAAGGICSRLRQDSGDGCLRKSRGFGTEHGRPRSDLGRAHFLYRYVRRRQSKRYIGRMAADPDVGNGPCRYDRRRLIAQRGHAALRRPADLRLGGAVFNGDACFANPLSVSDRHSASPVCLRPDLRHVSQLQGAAQSPSFRARKSPAGPRRPAHRPAKSLHEPEAFR
jgi:hypothetical protein